MDVTKQSQLEKFSGISAKSECHMPIGFSTICSAASKQWRGCSGDVSKTIRIAKNKIFQGKGLGEPKMQKINNQ
uniref:Uncharacterized protein n=1 Tax=Romanomermis culicivorax TaxID=13658 RepID=A0A915J1D7_ROMCU